VLSGGQQQMLTVARSLMGNPRLLLLDEPSEGLAPKVVEDLREQIKTLKESGMSIVLAEQNLSFVLYLSDYCHIMEKGEIKYSGTPADLREKPEILEQYLTL
jgi:branched-chain amino acid transport system ATP-binding protein